MRRKTNNQMLYINIMVIRREDVADSDTPAELKQLSPWSAFCDKKDDWLIDYHSADEELQILSFSISTNGF
jgi:hypothetical protein